MCRVPFNHGTHTQHMVEMCRVPFNHGTHTQHISDFFLKWKKTVGAYSLQIYDCMVTRSYDYEIVWLQNHTIFNT